MLAFHSYEFQHEHWTVVVMQRTNYKSNTLDGGELKASL